MGVVDEIDLLEEGTMGLQRFVRLKSDIKIEAPLKPGFFLPRTGLSDLWIGINYKKKKHQTFVLTVAGLVMHIESVILLPPWLKILLDLSFKLLALG